MKNALRISLLLIALLFLLAWRFAPARQASDEPEPSGEVRRPDAAVPDHTRTLRVLHGGAVEEMTMDEYLLGVLRAEMPASFELEALKAQAVAARTYTLHKMAQGAIARHPDADACDDITCCKAYETAEDAAAGWGAGALYYEEKLARAVAETDGEVIVYDGEPVLAVFFSSAAGHTQGDLVTVVLEHGAHQGRAGEQTAQCRAAGGAGGVQLFGLADDLGGIHAAEHDPAVLRQAADQICHKVIPPIVYTA